jgi:hypothetical protein
MSASSSSAKMSSAPHRPRSPNWHASPFGMQSSSGPPNRCSAAFRIRRSIAHGPFTPRQAPCNVGSPDKHAGSSVMEGWRHRPWRLDLLDDLQEVARARRETPANRHCRRPVTSRVRCKKSARSEMSICRAFRGARWRSSGGGLPWITGDGRGSRHSRRSSAWRTARVCGAELVRTRSWPQPTSIASFRSLRRSL